MDVRVEIMMRTPRSALLVSSELTSVYLVMRCVSSIGDRHDKIKTSKPRDMLHLHYYLSLLSQEYGSIGGISSACYGEAQHGPVAADGALERRVASNGYDKSCSALIGNPG